jgi:arabinogalactan endo-1,4-beta-galactosidase
MIRVLLAWWIGLHPVLSAETVFYKGGDISMLPRHEAMGAEFRDGGRSEELIPLLQKNGCNTFRVRLFVDPDKKGGVIQDLDYVIRLSRKIKDADGILLLDIHYSDTWADPGHQSLPKAWKDYSFEELEKQVESYSARVIEAMKRAGCLPDIVQVGNEIAPGFLWPHGQIRSPKGGWENFATLLKAAIRGVKQPLGPSDNMRIMIHIAKGGNARATEAFFKQMEKYDVEYDLIGQSYYPYHHGTIEDLRDNLNRTALQFRKPIVIVETAYPWTTGSETDNMDWPQTPQGQKQFLSDVIAAVRDTPLGLGKGVLWWYPESVPRKGVSGWAGGRRALFNGEGESLPALKVFREED